MSSLIEFLTNIHTKAAQYANEMENIMFTDPSSSLVKVRKFAEVILNDVFQIEEIELDSLTLSQKVSYLTREGYIKRNIQKSFDTIRISGNKAAHPSEQNDMAEAYKLHKEMYNIAIWYYELYSSKRLKIPLYEPPQPSQPANVEEIVKRHLQELLGKTSINDNSESIESYTSKNEELGNYNKSRSTDLIKKDLPEGESYLLREINRLKDSSQEAIENANQFSEFKKYLHVDRKIQIDLENVLQQNKDRKGHLILLCGNVGDGKSHLLAYLNENKKDLISNYKVFNDATESFSPNMDAMETLRENLKAFSDQNIENSGENIILAINMGLLHNFITTDHEEYSYSKLESFINDSNLFTPEITTEYNRGKLSLLSFGDYHSYELTKNGPISSFYTAILEKVTTNSNENPFYLAYKEDEINSINTMLHENYKLLSNKSVQKQIVQLVIQAIVKKKIVLSARGFLNFIADIIIPNSNTPLNMLAELEVLENSLPNLLFNHDERSEVLSKISGFDPIHTRSIHIDNIIMEFNTLDQWSTSIENYILDDISKRWLKPFKIKESLMGYSLDLFLQTFVRLTYLTNNNFAEKIEGQSYKDYLANLYYFNTGNKQKIKEFYEEIKSAMYMWKGSPQKDLIYINKASEKYRLAQKVNFKPSIDHLKFISAEILNKFKSTIQLKYYNSNNEKVVWLEIDYPLYNLLTKVLEGYMPNKKDEEDAIKFVEFIGKVMELGEKQTEMFIYFTNDHRAYSIKKGDFGGYVFERE